MFAKKSTFLSCKAGFLLGTMLTLGACVGGAMCVPAHKSCLTHLLKMEKKKLKKWL